MVSPTKPNLRVYDVYFVAPGTVLGSGAVVNQNNIDVDGRYEPIVQVINNGCHATDYTSDTTSYHVDQPPYGADGTFPVRLMIDYGKNVTIDLVERVRDQGPIPVGGSIFVRFPAITFSTEGTHSVHAYADVPGTPDSCTGTSFGCIDEDNETDNNRSEDFTVIRPSITLGSLNIVGWNHVYDVDGAWNINDVNNNDVRNITLASVPNWNGSGNVGLHWNGVGLRSSHGRYTCTGTGKLNGAGSNLGDFSGNTNVVPPGYTHVSFNGGAVHINRADMMINEPSPGNYHLYTISCETLAGGTVSDWVIINNGGVIEEVVDLDPTLESKLNVPVNTPITSLNFRVRNTGSDTISSYNYQLRIGGSLVGSGTKSGNIAANTTSHTSGNVTYTTPSTPTPAGDPIEMEVCVETTGMDAPACHTANLTVIDGPITPVDPPEVWATPTVIRQGGSTEVGWDPGSSPNCTLSPTRHFENPTPADPNTPGSRTITLTNETIFTITCGSLSDDVTVRVIPAIFET